VADKEEVEPTAEASSAQLSDASETSAALESQQSGPNGAKAAKDDASRNSSSAKVLEPAGVVAASGAKTARVGRMGRAPKGAPTTKRDRPVKPERTTPIKFVRQSIGELRKVVYPTGQQLINYFIVVLVFVLFVIAYVSLLDLGLGWAIFKIFS
jgi:preprotein translocase subunit SecE